MPHQPENETIFARAKEIIPGGVNSPVRAFKSVGGSPIFMDRAEGAYLYDGEGNRYIDYVGSWGPAILGHAAPGVISAIKAAADKGVSFGTATTAEIDLAARVIEMVPSIEMLRLVNSGTEATMTALRLARAVTGRDKVIKFAGCYHGHSDSFLVQAGSGALTLGVPDSPGVTKGTAADTLVAQFNNIDSVKNLLKENTHSVACVIVEPVVGNAGLIPPDPDFLPSLRELTTQHEVILIFDEVMTGFRLAAGGAQQLYGVRPDLTTLGKVIGAGCPIGALGGRKELMNQLAPAGLVYQAGTLSGNPLAVAAGLSALSQLTPETYQKLEAGAARLETGIRDNLKKLSLPWRYQRVGSMGCLFFTDRPIRNFEDVMTCDTAKFARYFQAMLQQGIYLPPSQFEANFISLAHFDDDIDKTVDANCKALQETSN
jgi:glutamate-1-semialdehyde 2,1-aminomutase